MRIREFITPLTKPSLLRLCKKRSLDFRGTKPDLLERIARSYKGGFKSLIDDLRWQDLYEIGKELDDHLHLSIGWRKLQTNCLRQEFLAKVGSREHASNQFIDDKKIQLFSSSNASGIQEVEHLSIRVLLDAARVTSRMTIISAYYSIKTLKKFLRSCRGEVRFILNGLGGHSLESQRNELLQLQKKFSEHRQVEIRLGFSTGVFHSKLYLFESAGYTTAWLGSANATSAGLTGVNEEIMLRVRPASASVIKYAEEVWSNCLPLDRCRAPVNSLISFFRTGLLYYKPYATLQKSFNPFLKWAKRVPTEVKNKLSLLSSEFAEENGINAFSFNRVLEADDARLGGTRNLKEQNPSDSKELNQLKFRNYAVETCYGYWVSEIFIEYVDSELKQMAQQSVSELKAFRKWLATRKQFIISAYRTYLDDCKEMLVGLEVDPKFYKDEILFKTTCPVEEHISKLVKKLSNNDRIEHYCHKFVSSNVPEMWEDPIARKEFEESFFESLERSAMSGKRSTATSKILYAIDNNDPEPSAESIRNGLERKLDDDDWYETHYLRSS